MTPTEAHELYSRDIRRLCAYGTNPKYVDDIEQEAWIKIINNWDSYDQERSFVAWASGKVRNAKSKVFKQEKKHNENRVYLPFLDMVGVEAKAIREALAGLPKQLSDIIKLRYEASYTLRETARTLHLPVSTVHRKELEAFKFIRERLNDCKKR